MRPGASARDLMWFRPPFTRDRPDFRLLMMDLAMPADPFAR
jgi:hypothetical protein